MRLWWSRRHGQGAATVHIHVHQLEQLYNSLDPSPFWDRDLDRDAAAYIEDEFRERLGAGVWHLEVHAHGGEHDAHSLQAAVANYYRRLAHAARIEMREHLRSAQLMLVIGLLFFAGCMAARELLRGSLGTLPRVVDEGLIILAWLSLWRPAESLAYEWLPMHRKRRLYERLAHVRVALRAPRAEATRPEGAA